MSWLPAARHSNATQTPTQLLLAAGSEGDGDVLEAVRLSKQRDAALAETADAAVASDSSSEVSRPNMKLKMLDVSRKLREVLVAGP